MLFEAIMNKNQTQVFMIHVPIKSDITDVESTTDGSRKRNEEVTSCKHFFDQKRDTWNVFLVVPLILVVIVTNIDLAVITKSYVIPFIHIDCQIVFNELERYVLFEMYNTYILIST